MTTRLPDDILNLIIRSVLFVPGVHELRINNPLDRSELMGNYRTIKDVLSAEETLASLQVVSSSPDWQLLLLPYKYMLLRLETEMSWSRLAKTISYSKSIEFPRPSGVAFYVRRLELCTAIWTSDQRSSAISLLKACTRIAILTVGFGNGGLGGTPVPGGVVRVLFTRTSESLQILRFLSPLDPTSVRGILRRIHRLKNLRALTIRFRRFASGHSPGPNAEPTALPNLQSLEVLSRNPCHFLEVMTPWSLPSLRHLSLRLVDTEAIDIRKLSAFLHTHGPNLEILEVDSLSSKINELLGMCTNLSDVVVDIRCLSASGLDGHQTIRRIGLRGFYPVREDSVFRSRVISCFDLHLPILVDKKLFPELRTIRLVDFDTYLFNDYKWRRGEVKQWAVWIRHIREHGVHFEDHDGKPLFNHIPEERLALGFFYNPEIYFIFILLEALLTFTFLEY